MLRGAQQIMFAGKLARFKIVDHQNIHVLQRFTQLRVGPLYPVVHGVQGNDFRPVGDLLKHITLQIGSNIREENMFGLTVFFGQLRFEIGEHI